MRTTLVSLLSFFLCYYFIYLSVYFSFATGKCLMDQQSLLLQLKNNLTFKPEKSSSKLKLWNQSNDCCNWSGVTCDHEGHVIGLDLSGEFITGGFDDSSVVFSLTHLQKLNLADNNFNSVIPSGFHKLDKLTFLNLSYAGFVGQIPTQISQLTRLVTLDISSRFYFTAKERKIEITNLQKLVQNLTSIRQLYLDGVSISVPGYDLQELSMSHCNLSGPLDPSMARLKNLSVIVLDQNNLSSPVPETFAHMKNLIILSLVNCGLTGTFPQKIFNIGTLSVIDISFNSNLHGFVPEFSQSGRLQTLRASNTSFSGSFPHSIGNIKHLSVLVFSSCQFNGTLPNSLSNLTELTYLDLSYNKFSGQIPSFGMAKNLTYLDLSHNGLSGPIPSSSHFEELNNLVILNLSYNSFNGSIPTSLFTLPLLQRIQLSYNKFSQLDDFINLSSTVSAFPGFLRNQSRLAFLDLSDNQIQGIVPSWIWKLQNLQSLNISHNLLTHLEGPLQNLTSNLLVLDLHHNKLQGSIPVFLENAIYLDYSSNKFSSLTPGDIIGNHLSSTIFLSLSNNSLHGNIPDSLCNASHLEVLDLSMNKISGTIPSCLLTMTETLRVLNMRNNSITGPIPDVFPASCALRTLDLHHNKLVGKIPNSLANCTTLEVLDLGENEITDVFPCLLKNISTFRVLVLRKNKLYGHIGCPNINGTWHMLQIVDLAINNFSGKIPGNSFARWEALMSDANQDEPQVNNIRFQFLPFASDMYYQDSVTIINNGRKIELVKILTIVTSIDFSSNRFEGPIPKEIMDFKELWVLNLSNNVLSGEIPSSIGNLRNLEALDLSKNSLSGEIPLQMTSLLFLSFLNLSFNHLVGKIPTSGQFATFALSSFEGNDGLYGPPLTEIQNGKEPRVLSQPEHERIPSKIEWNFISVEVGLIFGLGLVYAPLLLWERWRICYWQLTHNILCWIFPQMYLEYVRQRGQTYVTLRWQH